MPPPPLVVFVAQINFIGKTFFSPHQQSVCSRTIQIVLERVPVGLKRLAFSFSVAYLKMAGATRSKRRALQH